MNKRYFIFILVLLSLTGSAQNFDEYKKQQQAKFDKFKTENENQFTKLNESYQLYVQKQNAEFLKFIEESWKAFNTFKGETPPEMPKPDSIPSYRNNINDFIPEKIKSIRTEDLILKTNPEPDLINIPNRKFARKGIDRNVSLIFYAQEVNLFVDSNLFIDKFENTDQKMLKKLWDNVTKADYASLLDQLYDYRNKFNLNDWGYFKLIGKVADNLAEHDKNYEKALTWALMNLSGYNVKIGLFEDNCYLMIPTLQKMYSTYHLVVNEQKYFILEYNGNKISTYKQDFEGAQKQIDFNIYKPLNFENNYVKIETGNRILDTWEIKVNKNVIDFYNDYPLVDFPVYFNAQMNPETRNSLLLKLVPLLEGKSDNEKVEILLNFVQTGFEYKTDRDQFGREKFFFPDEVLFYPFSDCEDRSVLFSYLVRWFVGYDIIGLQYPKHMATAVAIPGVAIGDNLDYNGKNYTVCDPTFKNAPIGMTMTQYKGISPAIIPISKFSSGFNEIEETWTELIALGASKTSLQNSCFDEFGNYFITGNFTGTLMYKGKNISSSVDGTDVFVASFKNAGELNWMIKLDKGDLDYSNGITINNNKLYLSENSSSKNGEENQISISSFSRDGNELWSSGFPIDSSLIGQNFNQTYYFNLSGEIVKKENSFSGSQIVNTGIYVLDEEIVACFDFYNSLGLRKEDIIITSSSEMSVLDRLKYEYDKVIQASCERYTAALIAVFNLMKYNETVLTGQEISNMLLNSNSGLTETITDLIESLSKIEYFRNEKGKIIVKTKEGKKVSFYNLHFSDKAAIKITNISDQKSYIECLTGVRVGNAVIKFPLNCITIDLPKGDLLFDYANDHSKTNVNLKKDILGI